jgi:DNA-binding CsgD family transcriptional regulator
MPQPRTSPRNHARPPSDRFKLVCARSHAARSRYLLTPRDRDICDLLLQAFSNSEIAQPLGMTEAAVKMALKRICLRNDIDPCRDRRVLLALLYYYEKIQSPAA